MAKAQNALETTDITPLSAVRQFDGLLIANPERETANDVARHLEQLLNAYPDAGHLHHMLGVARLHVPATMDAVKHFEQSIAYLEEMSHPRVIRDLNMKLFKIWLWYEQAMDDIRRAPPEVWGVVCQHLKLDKPNDERPSIALTPHELSNAAALLRWLEQPVVTRNQFLLAIAYQQQERYQAAVDAFNRGVNLVRYRPGADKLTLAIWAQAAIAINDGPADMVHQ